MKLNMLTDICAPWYIHAAYADGLRDILRSAKMGLQFEKIEKTARYAYAINPDRAKTCLDDASPGSIAVIPIQGILMKRSYYSYDMSDISLMLNLATSNSNIQAIILDIDSPGGMVNGTMDLASLVKSCAAIKPVYAYVTGLCCSAAYWIAASCNSIIASNETVEIGSIGVMSFIADNQPAMEKEGWKFHELYATKSADKNKLERDILAGEYKEYIESVLDPLCEVFITNITANRKIHPDALTGKVYFAKAAIEQGLIDEIGNLPTAVERIRLAIENYKQNTFMTKFKNITASLGVELEITEEEGAFLNESQLQTIENRLVTTPTPASEPVVETLPEAQTATQLMAEVTRLKARIQALENLPAAQGGGANTDADPDPVPGRNTTEMAFAYLHENN